MFWRKPFKLVEVERSRPTLREEGLELSEGYKALNANPFFVDLLNRLRIQRQALKTRLEGTRFTSTNDINFVQVGVFWTGWLEREIARLTQAPARAELAPTEQEELAMRQIDSLIERVGLE